LNVYALFNALCYRIAVQNLRQRGKAAAAAMAWKGLDMKRLLTTSTALSIALMPMPPLPVWAQVLTDDGRVLAADGTVLCAPTAELACDLENPELIEAARIIQERLDAEAAAQAAAAAEAEAATQAAAAAEAEAATQAAAAAEAEAAAQAAAAAEAEAAAQAAAAAEAEAAAQAAADAEAEAAAQAAAAAEAEAAAQAAAAAEAEAAAQAAAAAEAEAAAQAAAAAEAEAAAQAAAAAEAEAAAQAAAAAEAEAAAQAAAEAEAAEEAQTAEPAPDAPAQEVAEPTTTAEPTTAPDAVIEDTASALAEAEAEITAPDGSFVDPAAGLAAAPVEIDPDAPLVDAPVISSQEVEALTTLLAAPADPASDAPAPEVAAPMDAPLPLIAPDDSAADLVTALEQMPLAEGAVAATVATITPEATRSSAQEFAPAPQTVSQGKKTGLSSLEKVGLFVLGAVVVGQILDATVGNKKSSQQVVSNTGDRVVVLNPDGSYGLYKDDDAILRQPGSTVRTETYNDGSSRTIVQRSDGTQVVTVRDATGRVLRRAQYDRLGRELVLLNEFAPEVAVDVSRLPPPRLSVSTRSDDAALRAALAAREIAKLNRSFSLRQIRDIPQVRALAAEVGVERVTFASGSAAISPEQANALADLGEVMQDMLAKNPREMFLIEGHTDATGAAAMNLALSDRRAESVALALSEYFAIPPENMIVQGYGETELRINTQASEPRNRRVAVRIITPLLNY
jgi:outer membrane protein OmpA-like peptidoglycan-associated protein